MAQTAEQKNGMAIAALVLGICSIVPLAEAICAIPALILGIIALSRKPPAVGRSVTGIALAGVGVLAQVFFVVVLGSYFFYSRATANIHSMALKARAVSDIANLSISLETFDVDCGRYPTTDEGLDVLLVQPKDVKEWNGPYMDASKGLPVDPWGRAYVYRCPGQQNPDRFDVFSLGPDGVEGTSDDIGNWTGN
ncbi:MAG: type II secretion system protein GspG [Phycisphaerae bacterium]